MLTDFMLVENLNYALLMTYSIMMYIPIPINNPALTPIAFLSDETRYMNFL